MNNDATSKSDQALLDVQHLRTYFHLEEGVLKAVDDVSFRVKRGEVLGILGESGCGKSMTAHSILRLTPQTAEITGNVHLERSDGRVTDLLTLKPSGKEMRSVRGGEISVIFQEPMTCLSPVHTVGAQIMETIRLHLPELDRTAARKHAIETLAHAGIPNPEQRFHEYAHQLSGGLRQRALIAIALASSPSLLIADEPTTALDVTVQAQILQLLKRLQSEMGLAIMYITHSLPVIAEIADRVMVMYLGRIVESGSMSDIFERPKHPYTRGLLKAIPHINEEGDRDRELYTIEGTVPLPLELPDQCGFCSRCPHMMTGLCDCQIPRMLEVEDGHSVRCFLYDEDSSTE